MDKRQAAREKAMQYQIDHPGSVGGRCHVEALPDGMVLNRDTRPRHEVAWDRDDSTLYQPTLCRTDDVREACDKILTRDFDLVIDKARNCYSWIHKITKFPLWMY